MKFFAAILLTALLGYAAPLLPNLPWWSFALSSFVVALVVHQLPFKAFLSGFLGLFLLWIIYAWIKDTANAHLLSTKVAAILPLGGNYILLLLMTALIGGVISGFAALTGGYVRRLRR